MHLTQMNRCLASLRELSFAAMSTLLSSTHDRIRTPQDRYCAELQVQYI
jgi:hypothetical protein